jgi:hypothetical protein
VRKEGIRSDFNGDGKLDIAEIVGSYPKLQLQILLGNGDGTFQVSPTTYPATYPGSSCLGDEDDASCTQLFAADLNGDNKLDLIVLQLFSSGNMTVFLGNGDGTFGPGRVYPVSGDLWGGAIADLNADDKLDIALANSTNTVPSTVIMLGNGDGTFQSPLALPFQAVSPGEPNPIAAGDFNNDGKMDLAVSTDKGIAALLQDYTPDFSLAASPPTSVTVMPGQTANYTINVAPGAGFTQTVSFACTGAPAQSTCKVSPSCVSFDGTKTATVSVAVATTAGTMGLTQPFNAPFTKGYFTVYTALAGFLGLFVLASRSARGCTRCPQLACAVALLCLLGNPVEGERDSGVKPNTIPL